jgi:hypothetical protein
MISTVCGYSRGKPNTLDALGEDESSIFRPENGKYV